MIFFLKIALFYISFPVAEPKCMECSILTPLIESGRAEEARKISEVNPTKFLGVKSHSGFITVNKGFNSNLFFWFFPKEGLEKTPWIIWLQGGPGISSMIGLFYLFGPLQIVRGEVTLRNVTWADDYSLLFLDNPVGAGFSFTDDDLGYPDNTYDIGAQMYEFLQQFLLMFPELLKAPLFIGGESYGGKYVPALAIQVHRHRNSLAIPLRGILMGGGFIDPRTLMHYSKFCKSIGVLDEESIQMIEKAERDIVHFIDNKKMVAAADLFNKTLEYIKKEGGISLYNFEKNPVTSAPEFEEFLSKKKVKNWIHVGNASFDLNNQVVYQKMLPDIMNTTKPWVEELLEHYGVLCYSGQLDIIVAYSSSKHTYNALQWSGKEKYVAAPRYMLRISKNAPFIGYRKSGGNFVEVLIRSAGHATMVEQPVATKFVINSFIDEFK